MPVKREIIEDRLFRHFMEKEQDRLHAKFLANRISRAFGADAPSVIASLEAKGWGFEDIFWLDQTSREWRKNPQAVLGLQESLEAAGLDSPAARRLALEPMLYAALDAPLISQAVRLMLDGGLTSEKIAYLAGKRPDIFLLGNIIIEAWLESSARAGKHPFEIANRLPKQNGHRTKLEKPEKALSKPTPVAAEEIPLSNADETPEEPARKETAGATPTAAYTTDLSGFEKETGPPIIFPAVETSVTSVETAPATPIAPEAETPATDTSDGFLSEAEPEKTIAAMPPAPFPSAPRQAIIPPPTSAAVGNLLKPLKLVKAAAIPVETAQPPIDRPDPEPEQGADWSKTAQLILKTCSKRWEEEDWERFRRQNPWINSKTSNEVQVLGLLQRWFSFSHTPRPENPRLRFLASFLLDKNLPQEKNLRPARIRLMVSRRDASVAGQNRAAKAERDLARLEKSMVGLKGLLVVPVEFVYLRLYALRSILNFGRPLSHPEMLLLPFEQVIPQAESAARGLSIPPPAGADVPDLQAKAQELRYRANELDARGFVPWRRPYVNMLLEPTRARFQARLAAYLKRKRKAELNEWNGARRSSIPYPLIH